MRELGLSLDLPTVRADYPALLRLLMTRGHPVAPRGQPTKELLDVTMRLDPHRPLVTGIGRGISTKLISMEALQLIGGVSYPARTIAAAPAMARFLDGGAFHGAYGPRVLPQLEAAVAKLQADRDTRQALMTVWNPLYDLYGAAVPHDVPCTALIQFLIRGNKLIQHTTMRSNDAWWGTPHDWGQFTQLQLAVAHALDLEAGHYYHHVVSLHLYERDFAGAAGLTGPPLNTPGELLTGIGSRGWTIQQIMGRARQLLEQKTHEPLSLGEAWHQRQQEAIGVAT